MLKGLEVINWHELEHAYGMADDVPELLRSLASADARSRQDALSKLYGNIYHQGTVFEATVYAIPFLIELSQAEAVQDRDKILIYLAHIARGHSYLEEHQNLLFYSDELDNLEFQVQIQQETTWARRVNYAVCSGTNIYLNLLEDNDSKLRTAAPYILACCQQRASEIIPHLKHSLAQERSLQVKASLILSLGLLEPPQSANIELFLQFLNCESSDLVRLSAAMTLIRLAKDKTPPEAIAIPIETIEHPIFMRESYAQLPWANSDIISDACNCLCYLDAAGNVAIPALINVLRTVDGYSALSVVRTLLYLAFNGQKLADTIEHNITALQISVIEAIASYDNVWQFNSNMAHLLRSFGLPQERNQLQAFL
ncbi:hypothetical protein [Chroococcidiopsis sp.]|uniref:hypothetical protein n=1 Tax=Chroococcidiopsis sp. TaxID=3088168 RepID=UPI003F387AEF